MKRLACAFVLLHYLGGQHPVAAQAWQRQAPDTDAVTGQVSRVVWVATPDGEATLGLTCYRNVDGSNPTLQLRLYSPRHVFDFHSAADGEDRVRLTWRVDADTVHVLNANVFKDGRNVFLFETGIDLEVGSSAQQLFALVTDTRPHTLALKWPAAFEAGQTARWRLTPNAAMRAVVAAC